jgi:hypothetical protein
MISPWELLGTLCTIVWCMFMISLILSVSLYIVSPYLLSAIAIAVSIVSTVLFGLNLSEIIHPTPRSPGDFFSHGF